jgi:outer membrane protein assembly factor BamB
MKLHCVLPITWLLAVAANADDWPQYRGPDRSGVSREKGLLKGWPEKGPKLLWTFRNAGLGFSPPSIVGQRLYTMGTRGKVDFLYAIDTATGEELWATELGPARPADWGDGPCATPTVDGNRLYALTTFGDLHCVDTSGKKVWNVHLKNELKGKIIHDGRFTESPLIDGDRVICTPGGSEGTFAALDKRTGQLVWRSRELKEGATSASAIRIEVDGIAQFVALTGKGVAAVAASDGRLLWKSDIPAAWIMVATPIFADRSVFVTTGYGRGCGLVQLRGREDKVEAHEVYRNKVMKNHHGGVVLVGGYLYGHSDPNGWVCQEFATGKQVWRQREKLGKGSLTCADGHLYCYSERNGTAVLVKASPSGWREKGRFTIPTETKLPRKQGRIWTPPVVANGRLYLRDQDLLYCYDVREAR